MGFLPESFKSFFNRVNEVKESFEQEEGALDYLPELSLDKSDEELLDLKKEWEKNWKKFEPKIREKQEENELYWLGLQNENYSIDGRPIADNLIFESLETFLPIATKNNPDPVVYGENNEEGIELSRKVKTFLVYHADRLRLKLRLKKICRYWALYFLGVGKIGWDEKTDDITFEAIRPQKLILDPNSYINDDMEYTGDYIGEYIKERASSLIEKFPKKKKEIEAEAKKKMGTHITYIEWWTDEFVFWTMKDVVLGKMKNYHWNGDSKEKVYDEYGEEAGEEEKKGNNHFSSPKKPYVFLSVFNIGKNPFDATSLISQNLANQDIINARTFQIDDNVRMMNNLFVVSSDYTKEEASRILGELKDGSAAIRAPKPDAGQAVSKIPITGLAPDVYRQLDDSRNELRNIFGTRGSSPEGISNEGTVRGKMIISQQDGSRIGGGVSEYLEQFADQVYNWFVQMMVVHYDMPREASTVGEDRQRDYQQLSKDNFRTRLTVSVKSGSLIPKDEFTIAEQAKELFAAGAIDPVSLLDKMDWPDPETAAERGFLYKAAPNVLFPEAAQQAQEQQMQDAAQQAALTEAATPQEGLPPEALTGQIPPEAVPPVIQ